ncbi:hypothetical protein GIB67_000642 [Kingdonia uniflora]|uniref:Pentatricopeptide repeat-containing protein n=1 Tax=Kingdonia uniflora TaxID=39325 RepID=A0A7J7NDV4_9MAGN|nr:hypothetical protein GIB67_000642 [Kingdonia uniflora]
MASLSHILYRTFCTTLTVSAPVAIKSIKELIYEEKDLTEVVENFMKLSESKFFRLRHGGRNNTSKITICRLALAKQFSAIEEILEEQKNYNNILKEGFTIQIISFYGKILRSMTNVEPQFCELMKEFEFTPDTYSYTIIIGEIYQRGILNEAIRMLDEI